MHKYHTIPYHYVTLPFLTLRYVTLLYITLNYITLLYFTLSYFTLHYFALRCIALQYITYILILESTSISYRNSVQVAQRLQLGKFIRFGATFVEETCGTFDHHGPICSRASLLVLWR